MVKRGALCTLVAIVLVATVAEASRHDSLEKAEADAAAILKDVSVKAGDGVGDLDKVTPDTEDTEHDVSVLGNQASSEVDRSEKEVEKFVSGKGVDGKSGTDIDSDPFSRGTIKQGEKSVDKTLEDEKIGNEDRAISSEVDSFVHGEDPEGGKQTKSGSGSREAKEDLDDGKKEMEKAKKELADGVKESKEAKHTVAESKRLRKEAQKKKAEAEKAEADAHKAATEAKDKVSSGQAKPRDDDTEKEKHAEKHIGEMKDDKHDEKKHQDKHDGDKHDEEHNDEKHGEEHGNDHGDEHSAQEEHHEESGGGVREKEASAKSGVKAKEKQDDIDKGIDEFGSEVEKFLGLHRPPPLKHGHGHGHGDSEHGDHEGHEGSGHGGHDEGHESSEHNENHDDEEKVHEAEEKEREAEKKEEEAKAKEAEAAEKKSLEERIKKDQVISKDGKSLVIEGQEQSRSLGEDDDDRMDRLAQDSEKGGNDDKSNEADSDKDGFDLFGDDDEKESSSAEQHPEPEPKPEPEPVAKPSDQGVSAVQKSDESTVPTPVTESKPSSGSGRHDGDDDDDGGGDGDDDDDDDYKAAREQDVIPIQNKLEAELKFAQRMSKLYSVHVRKTSHKLFNEWQIAVKEDVRIPWGRVLREAHKHFSNGTAQDMERAVAKEDPMAIDEKYEKDAEEETAYDLLTLEDCFRMWLESVRRLKSFRKSRKSIHKTLKERDDLLKGRGLDNLKLVTASMVTAVKFINAGRAECRPNELPPLMDYSPLSLKVNGEQISLSILFDHAVVSVTLSADGNKAVSSKPEPCQIGGLDAYVNFDVGSPEILDAAGAVAEALNDLSSQCENVKPTSYVSTDIVVQNAQTKAVNGLLIRADIVVKARPLEVLLYARYMVASSNSVGENDLSILKTQPDVCEFLGGKKGQYKAPSAPANGTHVVPLHPSSQPYHNNTVAAANVSAAPKSDLNRVSGTANSTIPVNPAQRSVPTHVHSPAVGAIPITSNAGGTVAQVKAQAGNADDEKAGDARPAVNYQTVPANHPDVHPSKVMPSVSIAKAAKGTSVANEDDYDDYDDDEDDEDDVEKALEDADATEKGYDTTDDMLEAPSDSNGSDLEDPLYTQSGAFRGLSSLLQLGEDEDSNVKPPVKLQEDRPSEFKSVRFAKAKMQREINGIAGVRDVGLDENTKKSKIPEKFHSFEQWPACKTPVFDQGRCGAGYAFAAVDALQTRLCIVSGGRMKPSLSPQDLINCDSNEFGCDGGFTYKAFDYLENVGVVSESCRAYTGATGECNRGKCDNREAEDHSPYYNSGRYKFRNYSTRYTESGSFREEVVQQAILEGGPVVAGMDLYPGFMSLREAVYSPPDSIMVSGNKNAHLDSKERSIGAHTVLLVGWETIDGVKYWIAKNSLGSQWGDKGYFLIRRGVNSCSIENFILWAEAERPCAIQNDCNGHGSCVFKEEGKSLKWGNEEIEDQVFHCACDEGWDGEDCSQRIGGDERKVSEDATKLVNKIESKTEKEYNDAEKEVDKTVDTDDQDETNAEISEIGEEMNALGTGHEKGEPDHPDREQDKLYAEQINSIRSGRNKFNQNSATASTGSNGDAVMSANESTSSSSAGAVASAMVVVLLSLAALLL